MAFRSSLLFVRFRSNVRRCRHAGCRGTSEMEHKGESFLVAINSAPARRISPYRALTLQRRKCTPLFAVLCAPPYLRYLNSFDSRYKCMVSKLVFGSEEGVTENDGIWRGRRELLRHICVILTMYTSNICRVFGAGLYVI